MKVYVETYGCAKNQADSHIMKAQIENSDHKLSDFEEADVVIVNTCIVKSRTENRVKRRIKNLRDSNKSLIVAGCMPEAMTGKVEEIAPKASMINPTSLEKINSLLDKVSRGERGLYLKGENLNKAKLSKRSPNPVRRIIGISEGCNGACSFCITKKARKNLYSFPKNDIIEEVRSSVEKGFKEFYLSGEDTGCYGFDSGTCLPELMNGIADIDGKFRARVGMMNPNNALKVLDELIDSYNSEKFYNFLHLPVQSGSNPVLKDMNRNYTVEEFERVVERFRDEIPNLTLATDIIVGFPTESKEDFRKTLELLRRIKPKVVNISKYGSRPKTLAKDKFKDLDSQVVKKRSKKTSELVEKISIEEREKMVGDKREVLITERGKKGGYKSRDGSYNQIIVDKGNPGEFRDVRIKSSHKYYLKGEIED